jgi:hypothetical protein
MDRGGTMRSDTMRIGSRRFSTAIGVQAVILRTVLGRPRRSIVSANKIIAKVRSMHPKCRLGDHELARMVRDAAMSLGLIPVFTGRSEPDK